MDSISRLNVVHQLQKRSLLIAINCVGSLAIFFFGYDQGMMGSVNVSIDYATKVMKFGHVDPGTTQVVVDRVILQGGIVGGGASYPFQLARDHADSVETSVYYLGCLAGCLLGGWIAEKIGRIRVIALGSIWGVFGAALQTSAQNANWMICGKNEVLFDQRRFPLIARLARCINGIGTGMLNVIVPVWVCIIICLRRPTAQGRFPSQPKRRPIRQGANLCQSSSF